MKVLLRIYGRTHGEQALETVLTDTVVFTLLSERKLGPKLHGIFPGGRIEQYIPVSWQHFRYYWVLALEIIVCIRYMWIIAPISKFNYTITIVVTLLLVGRYSICLQAFEQQNNVFNRCRLFAHQTVWRSDCSAIHSRKFSQRNPLFGNIWSTFE